MIEYPAMIYRTNRNKTFVANCMIKNLIGFGKTEEAAINNLKESLQSIAEHVIEKSEINITPVYGLFKAQ